jgi:hypothetical protein
MVQWAASGQFYDAAGQHLDICAYRLEVNFFPAHGLHGRTLTSVRRAESARRTAGGVYAVWVRHGKNLKTVSPCLAVSDMFFLHMYTAVHAPPGPTV